MVWFMKTANNFLEEQLAINYFVKKQSKLLQKHNMIDIKEDLVVELLNFLRKIEKKWL